MTGLQRLVGKIGEMRVGEKVRGDVEGAVGELEEVSISSSLFLKSGLQAILMLETWTWCYRWSAPIPPRH